MSEHERRAQSAGADALRGRVQRGPTPAPWTRALWTAAGVAAGASWASAPLAALQSAPDAASGAAREHVVLTLDDALRRATRFNPQYRQALNRMELEGPQRREALGAFLPSVSLSFNTGQNFRQERTAVDFFGNPIENPEIRTVSSSNASQSGSISVDLWQGGRRFAAYDQARAQARVDRFAARRDLNGILAEVQRQFLFAQRQEARLAVEEELLAAREQDFEVAERRFELAAIGRADLLGAELDLESQRVTVRDAQGQVEKAMLALRRAIGDPELDAIEVLEEPPAPFDPAELDVAGLVAEAMESSPAVAVAEAARGVRSSALGSARGQRWPTISLAGSFSRSSFGPERTALFDLDPEDFNGGARLSVSIPVFQQFRASQQIASAEVELRNAGEQVRQAELELDEQVRSRYVDLETAWANVQQRGAALAVAAERLRIVEEEYRLATRGIEELRAAVRDHAAAQRDAVEQRFEFAAALVGLYEAAGLVAERSGLAPGGASGSDGGGGG